MPPCVLKETLSANDCKEEESKIFNECMQQNERKDFHRRPKAVGFPINILVKDGKIKKIDSSKEGNSELKKWLSEPVCRIIPAFINTLLDYWNSLYVGTSQPLLHRLQLGQNAAAHLLTGKWKHDHITLIPASLHSLPVHFKIDLKILLLVFKTLSGLAPHYLAGSLLFDIPTRVLKSANQLLLSFPKTRLKTRGNWAFGALPLGSGIVCPDTLDLPRPSRCLGLHWRPTFAPWPSNQVELNSPQISDSSLNCICMCAFVTMDLCSTFVNLGSFKSAL